jgi:hypothetical protein
VFSSANTYVDCGAVYGRDKTYEVDIISIGTAVGQWYRRFLAFGTSTNTTSGAAAFILTPGAHQRAGWWFYLGTAWDSSAVFVGTSENNYGVDLLNGKTLKVYLDSTGIATIYYKTIGADDSTYTRVGQSHSALNDFTNGHVYIGSSTGGDFVAAATIGGIRIYEGEH